MNKDSLSFKSHIHRFFESNTWSYCAYFFQFSFAFILVFTLIGSPALSLVDVSGDAYSIWQTILSFNSGSIKSSYVLYKGFLSIYPYLWLYKISLIYDLNQFVLIKIYHAILFGLAAGIAVPYCVTKLLKIKNNLFVSFFGIYLSFVLLSPTYIFSALMIDLPSFAFFSLAMAVMLMQIDTVEGFFSFILASIFGLLLGLSFSSSGQYSLSGFILLLIFVFFNFSKYKNKKLKILPCLFLAAIFFCIPKVADFRFNAQIVEPMRISGEWIPSGGQWFASSLSRMMDRYTGNFPNINNRGKAIMLKHLGDDFGARYPKIKEGSDIFSFNEYLQMLAGYPVDFIMMWFTKLFLAISFDGGQMNVSHLLASYTSLIICFLFGFNALKSQDIFRNKLTYVWLSILATVTAPVFLHIEMRYSTSLISYLLFFAIYLMYSNYIEYANLKKKYLCTFFKLATSQIFISYIVLLCLLNLLLLSFYGALTEVSSADPSKILIKIF